MSVPRRACLWTMLAVIVLGHLYCLTVGPTDLWPFSRYAMYSKRRVGDHAEQYVIVGVTAERPPREVEMFLEWEYIRPLYRGSLHRSLARFARSAHDQRLIAAAEDCLRRYEARRKAGKHSGPALAAIRVYRYLWQYDQVDPHDRRPTDRELLAESRLPQPEVSR